MHIIRIAQITQVDIKHYIFKDSLDLLTILYSTTKSYVINS